MKQFYILCVIFPLYAFSGGYEPDESEPVQYVIKDLNKIHYESEFLKLNNSVQAIDTDNKVLKKEVYLLNNYFKTTLKNQEYTYKTQIDNLLEQHKHELNEQEKRYEAIITQQIWIFGIVGTIFTVLMLIIGFVGYNTIKSMISKIIKKDHSEKTKQLVKAQMSQPETIKEIKAGLDTLEMDENDNNDDFSVS